MKEARKILKETGLSDAEISVYFCLLERGALSAGELVRHTGVKRPTTYYALRQLFDRGLVAKTGTPGVERFRASPVELLLSLGIEKKHEVETLHTKLEGIIPTLLSLASPDVGLPTFSFYEGDKAMRQAINESLYCKEGKIDYITPHDNFFWQTNDFHWADAYIKERTARGIQTRHLWERLLDPETMARLPFDVSHIRIMPKNMWGKLKTMILLFDDKIMYISSKKNSYAIVIRSQEHRDMVSAMYEALWDVSVSAKDVTEQGPDTRKERRF